MELCAKEVYEPPAKERKAQKAEKDRLAFNKLMYEKNGPVWLPGESEWYFSELKKQNSK